MKNSKLKLINFIFAFAFIVIIFGSGYKLGEYKGLSSITFPSNSNTNVKNLDFSLFWNVWAELEKKYVDKTKLDSKKMFYGAIKGMVAALDDPYTFFLTPDENIQSKDDLSGKFEGIGAQLGLKDGRIVIIAPLKQSPAEKAGVRTGDFINEVDGQKTASWTLPQAVSKIRGPKGSKVKLTLERSGKELQLTIIRDQIIVLSIELSYEKNLVILKLNQFGENTNEEWDKADSELEK